MGYTKSTTTVAAVGANRRRRIRVNIHSRPATHASSLFSPLSYPRVHLRCVSSPHPSIHPLCGTDKRSPLLTHSLRRTQRSSCICTASYPSTSNTPPVHSLPPPPLSDSQSHAHLHSCSVALISPPPPFHIHPPPCPCAIHIYRGCGGFSTSRVAHACLCVCVCDEQGRGLSHFIPHLSLCCPLSLPSLLFTPFRLPPFLAPVISVVCMSSPTLPSFPILPPDTIPGIQHTDKDPKKHIPYQHIMVWYAKMRPLAGDRGA
jgi:hypothetical protein